MEGGADIESFEDGSVGVSQGSSSGFVVVYVKGNSNASGEIIHQKVKRLIPQITMHVTTLGRLFDDSV